MNTNNAVTITGSGKIACVINGTAYNVTPDHPNYVKLLDAARTMNWQCFVDNIDITTAINAYLTDGVKVEDGAVTYMGDILHNSLTERIVNFMRNDLPFNPLVKFLENLLKNPSKRAVDELYDFLEVGELPITEDGCFLAFKNVKADYTDIHSGTFDNSVGKTCEMIRNKVDENKDRTCSYGLHFCSIDYLPHFSDTSGGHTMIVKINPADVVAIPADYNNTKGRCCKYVVVGEYMDNWRDKLDRGENGWDSPLYSSNGEDYEDDCDNDLNECCHYNGEDCDCYDDDVNPSHSCGTDDPSDDGCCGGSCHADDCGTTPDDQPAKPTPTQTPTAYHNVRDDKGRFIKKNQDISSSVVSILKNFFKN
jgi:hypothetical protein